jgi:hypothetical protein
MVKPSGAAQQGSYREGAGGSIGNDGSSWMHGNDKEEIKTMLSDMKPTGLDLSSPMIPKKVDISEPRPMVPTRTADPWPDRSNPSPWGNDGAGTGPSSREQPRADGGGGRPGSINASNEEQLNNFGEQVAAGVLAAAYGMVGTPSKRMGSPTNSEPSVLSSPVGANNTLNTGGGPLASSIADLNQVKR